MKPTNFYGFQARDSAGFTLESAYFRRFKTALISWFHLVFDTGGLYEFNVDSHSCAIIIRTNGITFNYDLAVDGYSVTTGQPIEPIRPLPTWFYVLITVGFYLCVCIGSSILDQN